jgi:hypothetical protein
MGRKKKVIEEKEVICITHDEITELADLILSNSSCIDENCISNVIGMCNEITQWAQQIKDKTAQAKLRGQAMENRMRAYRKAVEELGFIRKES